MCCRAHDQPEGPAHTDRYGWLVVVVTIQQEIEQGLTRASPPGTNVIINFTPHLMPMSRSDNTTTQRARQPSRPRSQPCRVGDSGSRRRRGLV